MDPYKTYTDKRRTVILAVATMTPVELQDFFEEFNHGNLKSIASIIREEEKAIEQEIVDQSQQCLYFNKGTLPEVTTPKVIESIKLVRQISGMGLKAAKDFIDEVRGNGQPYGNPLNRVLPFQFPMDTAFDLMRKFREYGFDVTGIHPSEVRSAKPGTIPASI